jgi:hypothetical protein
MPQYSLEGGLSQTRSRNQIIFEGGMHQGKASSAAFGVVFRRIDQRIVCELTGPETEAFWFLKIESHRLSCDSLSSEQFYSGDHGLPPFSAK